MRTLLHCLVLALLAALPCHAGITINGLPTMADRNSHMLLCSAPAAWFDKPLTATIACDVPGAKLAVNGTSVASGAAYAFGNIAQNRTYAVAVTTSAGTTTHQLAFTLLPIIAIDGDFDSDYHPATLAVIEPGERSALTLPAKAKYRGGITNQPNSHKHNFHVKLLDEQGNKVNVPLLGLRDDNNWILDAGQIDMARIRNHVAMDLWRDFSAKPYHFAHETRAVNGSHSAYAELFVNGNYHGLYSLMEAIDRKQLQLKKFDSRTGQIHGLLWKSVSWDSPVRMYNVPDTYNNQLDTLGGMALKYPELDDLSPTDWEPLYNAANFVATSSDEDFGRHVGEYFDLPVLRDYYLLCQLLKAIDNRGKNMYWFIHDASADRRISVTPWDLDATAGQYYTDWSSSDKRRCENPNLAMTMSHNLFDRLIDLNAGGFYDHALVRYHQLRSSTFTLASLRQRYTAPLDMLKRSGTTQREKARWSGDSDIANLELDFDAQRTLLRNWFNDRLAFLDKQFALPASAGDVDGNGIADIADMNAIVNVMIKKASDPDLALRADIDGSGAVDIDDLNIVVAIMVRKFHH